MIEIDMKGWEGLDRPQFKQRVLNTWNQWEQYKNLPNRRAGMFFNVLPSPVATGGDLGISYDIDRYYQTSLYCQGGSDIDANELLERGEVWWLNEDNECANNFVRAGFMGIYRLQTVAEAIGSYFDSPEFKAKGKYENLSDMRLLFFSVSTSARKLTIFLTLISRKMMKPK